MRLAGFCLIACLVSAVPAAAQTAAELYGQGMTARKEQRFKDAVAVLERAAALEPDNADMQVQLGFSRSALGDNAGARAAFTRALEIAPGYQDARFGLAQIDFRNGDLQQARERVDIVLKAQPGNAEAMALLASIKRAEEATARAAARVSGKIGRPTLASPKASKQGKQLEALLSRAREQRIDGHFKEAEALYRKALALSPGNAEILVALGLVAGFQQDFTAAESYFLETLRRRPGDLDARLGMVRLAIWRGETARARKLIDPILAEYPDNGEVLALSARIALAAGDNRQAEAQFQTIVAHDRSNTEALVGLGDARRAGGNESGAREAYRQALLLQPNSADVRQRLAATTPRKWRLDVGSEVSDLSGGRTSWTDNAVSLSYRLSPQTTVAGRLRLATRWGRTDTQFEARLDQALTPDLSVYGLLAATPDADFLAEFSVGGGASWRAIGRRNDWGPLFLNVDVRYDLYPESKVTTVSPGLQYFLLGERLGISARWVHSQDDAGVSVDGYVLRGDIVATDRLRFFAGYGNAPEISEGAPVEARTIFTGLSLDLKEDVTLNASYAHEERAAFDRDTFGLGLSLRF